MNNFQRSHTDNQEIIPRRQPNLYLCHGLSLLALRCSNKNWGSEDYLQTLLLSWVTAGADIAILSVAAGILGSATIDPKI